MSRRRRIIKRKNFKKDFEWEKEERDRRRRSRSRRIVRCGSMMQDAAT